MLVKNPEERLGASTQPGFTYADLKAHKFFNGLNVDNLFNDKPPDTPEIEFQKNKEKVELEKVKEAYDRHVTQ
jgi:hypothetical protein